MTNNNTQELRGDMEISNKGYIRFMMVEAIRRGETAVAEKCKELLKQNQQDLTTKGE